MEYHELLLHCAGQLPDELVCAARSWLAGLPDVYDDPMPWYAMSPLGPDELAGYPGEAPACLDLTGDGQFPDPVDATAVGAVTGRNPATALWRAWRYPVRPRPGAAPKRIYLVLVDGDAPRWTDQVQQALLAGGEPDPQVEVFTDPGRLPAYQRTALACGALLWTAREAQPIRVAAVVDAPDHPVLTGERRDAVLRYLTAGTPLVAGLGEARTDGVWVWSEAVCHHLAAQGRRPDPELLDHIQKRGYVVPPVDVIALHRALAALNHTPVGAVEHRGSAGG